MALESLKNKRVDGCLIEGCSAEIENTQNREGTGKSKWRFKCSLPEHKGYWFNGPCWNCGKINVSRNECADCEWYICPNCKCCTPLGCISNEFKHTSYSVDEKEKAILEEYSRKLKDPRCADQHKQAKIDLELFVDSLSKRGKVEVGGPLGEHLIN
jgi:hypothetical protein